MPARDRVARARGCATGLPVDEDLARVGLVEAVEDRHQRRLAGAVLADDAVDRAARDGEVDVLVGVDRAEALVDADELDGERRGGRLASIRAGSGRTIRLRPFSGGGRSARALLVGHVVVHLDRAGDDVGGGLVGGGLHLGGDQRLVVVVERVADAVLRRGRAPMTPAFHVPSLAVVNAL